MGADAAHNQRRTKKPEQCRIEAGQPAVHAKLRHCEPHSNRDGDRRDKQYEQETSPVSKFTDHAETKKDPCVP